MSDEEVVAEEISERVEVLSKQTLAIERQVVFWRRAAFLLAVLGALIAVLDLAAEGIADLGELGTLVGGTVGPLWSLAGLVLVYVAFLGQRRQILLQEEGLEISRQELRDTREELKGQREQLELQRTEMTVQNATMRQQAFEQSFFELLRFHREIASELQARPGNAGEYIGQAAFRVAMNQLAGLIATDTQRNPNREYGEWPELLAKHFHDTCLAPESDFGNYFRALYHILRQIDQNGLPRRARYASLLRAQLSNAELVVVALDGLTPVGREKFKPLIEKYGFLKPVRMPPSLERFKSYYSPSAFYTAAVA